MGSQVGVKLTGLQGSLYGENEWVSRFTEEVGVEGGSGSKRDPSVLCFPEQFISKCLYLGVRQLCSGFLQ